jgi:chemotaxis protein CheX
MSNEKAYAGIPYIENGKPVVLEYTGIVGISGNIKGCIYLTATGEMLRELAQIIIDTDKTPKEDIKDLVGEIANTISGNVRKAYGRDFMISVPVVLEGKLKDIKLPGDLQSSVIPMRWRDYKSYLVVCLEQ